MIAPQLHYVVTQERIAELHRGAQQARLSTKAATERRNPRKCNSTTHVGARLARLTARLAPSRP
jgi:hypothetical protein